MTSHLFEFDQLSGAPLVVDAVYLAGEARNKAGGDLFTNDPLQPLLGVKPQGGIRPRKKAGQRWPYVVLKSTGVETDWPDRLDPTTGHYTYYGDNRTVGHALLEKDGNRLLDEVFGHLIAGRRDLVPPFLVFRSAGKKRDAQFVGIAAPGYPGLQESEVLIPKW